jgi:hypothetical protein
MSARSTPTESDGSLVIINEVQVTAGQSKSTAHHVPALESMEVSSGLAVSAAQLRHIYSRCYAKALLHVRAGAPSLGTLFY